MNHKSTLNNDQSRFLMLKPNLWSFISLKPIFFSRLKLRQSSMGVARDCHGIMANDHIHKAIAIIFSTGRGQNLLTLQENQTILVTF